MKATSWQLNGATYKGGMRIPGHGPVECDDGLKLYVPKSECVGIDGVLAYAEKRGIDVSDCRSKLDHWQKTGEGVRFTLH